MARAVDMTAIDWFRSRLGALGGHGWGRECPDGIPVPTAERYAALECDSVPLSTLLEGDGGTVTCLESPGGGATGRLVAMGVLPGATILLVQRSPAFVMRLGHTELAVDAELAARIRVRRDRR